MKPRNYNLFILFLAFLGLFSSSQVYCQTSFSTKTAKVNLFSTTPLEDIKAESNVCLSVIVPKGKQILFQLSVKSLIFPRPLMQEHFNENYIESDKYPTAIFKGTMVEDIDFTKDGTYTVNATGIFTVHGVAKQRTIGGKLTILNGKPSITCNFDVLCADHKIKIPKIVFTKIAQNINISVNANYN